MLVHIYIYGNTTTQLDKPTLQEGMRVSELSQRVSELAQRVSELS